MIKLVMLVVMLLATLVAYDTANAQSCSSPTRVQISQRTNTQGKTVVSVASDTGPITQVSFSAGTNAVLDLPAHSVGTRGPIIAHVNVHVYQFILHSLVQGVATTQPFTVTDSCGDWP